MRSDLEGFQLGAVKTPQALAKMTMEELAGHVLNRTSREPGWDFLAGCRSESGEKQQARKRILSAMPRFSHLKILTMPSAFWHFEKQLLVRREGETARSARTKIAAVEIDEAIFRIALDHIPGKRLRYERGEPFSSFTCQTDAVHRFYRASFEDFSKRVPRSKKEKFNAAWLDFNGPLTLRRAKCVGRFVAGQMHRPARFFLTVFNGHYDSESFGFLSEYENRMDALEAMLHNEGLPRAAVRIERFAYMQAGAPMIQLGWAINEE